jgi:hypothetical protein
MTIEFVVTVVFTEYHVGVIEIGECICALRGSVRYNFLRDGRYSVRGCTLHNPNLTSLG